MNEELPSDLNYFLQDIGIIDVLEVVEKVKTEIKESEDKN